MALVAQELFCAFVTDVCLSSCNADGLPALERIMHFYKDIGMTLPPVCILSGEVSNSDMHARFRAAGATEVRGTHQTEQKDLGQGRRVCSSDDTSSECWRC